MTDLSVDAPLLTGRSPGLQINGKVAAIAAAILLGGSAALSATISWRQGALYLLGGVLGLSLVACRASTDHRTIAATFVGNGSGYVPQTITVTKKDTVIINVGNGTDKTHGFSIEGYGIRKTVDPNKTLRVKFRATRGGTFKIFCQLHPTHQTAVLQVQ